MTGGTAETTLVTGPMDSYLDAALRLARWLTRNEHDARDVVQDVAQERTETVARFGDDGE